MLCIRRPGIPFLILIMFRDDEGEAEDGSLPDAYGEVGYDGFDSTQMADSIK